MNDLFIRVKNLKRKIDNLEYEIYAARAKMEKARVNYNYYRYVVDKFKENLSELRIKDRVVSIIEYSKIIKEYKQSTTALGKYKSEYDYFKEYIDVSEKRFGKMNIEFDKISKILNSQKVVLLFRKKE